MKKIASLVIILFLNLVIGNAQSGDTLKTKQWEINAEINLYLIRDDVFLLPVFRANKNVLHLEGRYNYEDYQTFSAWAGYNFRGGKKLEYVFTPMLGGLIGNTKGMAVALEMNLTYKKFDFYSEIEYLADAEGRDNDYLYDWTDFTYSPKEWLWLGISAQRTRLVQTPLEIQRGILVGAGFKGWELSAYVFDLGFPQPYGVITLSYNH
ncbi:MAG: hypothetical protein PSX36_02730 [bacterium]|nr:hypothetical protein [bacterium]